MLLNADVLVIGGTALVQSKEFTLLHLIHNHIPRDAILLDLCIILDVTIYDYD